MSVTKSNKNNITSPNGNSLAVFVDVTDNILKLKDVNGQTDNVSDYVSGGGGGVTSVGVTSSTLTVTNSPITTSGDIDVEIPDGFLKVGTGVTSSLQPVTDTSGTATPLNLSNSLVQSTSTVKITTTDTDYIDCEDGAGNNRFTVSRNTASQTVNVDFASNPTVDDTVGAIRTVKGGGANPLAEILSFTRDGQVSVNGNELVNYVPDLTSGGALAITSANYALYNATVYNVTGAVTISVNNTVPDGFNMTIIQQDANQCVIAAGAGLTLRNNDNNTASAGQWAVIKIIRSGANLLLSGDTDVPPSAFNAFLFLEPQDATSQNDLGTYMFGVVGVTWFGFGNNGGPPTANYQLNWETYAKWTGFVNGGGAGSANFITATANMKGNIRQASGIGVDSFGIPTRQYNAGTIKVLPTVNVNTAVSYINSLWIPLAGVNNAISQSQFSIGNRGEGTSNIQSLTNGSSTLLSAAANVVITTGAAIPAGTYRVLYNSNTINAVTSGAVPYYYKQDNIQI